MEQNPNPNTSLFSLNLDAQNSYTLRSAATWAKVLGVAGLIIGILSVLAGILFQMAITTYSNTYDNNRYRDAGINNNTLANMGLAMYVFFGLIFIISSIFALNAGNKINRGLRNNDQGTLNAGFAGARNYFAFWAILMILMLVLMVIGILAQL